MSKKYSISILLALIVVSSLITSTIAPPPTGRGPPPSANLDQLRNGKASDPVSPGEWVNGNLNPQQSHYVEGYSIPYRVVMENLEPGIAVTLRIGFDIKKNDKHAIDYLTSYNYIDNPSHMAIYGHDAEEINPLDGVSDVSGTIDYFIIPPPSSTGSPVSGQPTSSFDMLANADKSMTLFGGDLTSIVYFDQGDLSLDTDEAQVDITFTPDSSTAVLAWGGHIASLVDWGYEDNEPRSASGISGSPYHTRLISLGLDKIGSQDRSLKIDPPSILVIKKVIDWGYYSQYINGWEFTFLPSWGESFTLGHMDSESFVLLPGTYSITETGLDGWILDKIRIEGGGYDEEIDGPTAEVEIGIGDKITITFINRPPDFVIPESPLGTLGSLIAMIGVVALITALKKGVIHLSIK